MDVLALIRRHCNEDSIAFGYLTGHGRAVAAKALDIARRMDQMNPDLAFIEEAALLHDIGMLLTDLPAIGCFGPHPYISHGYLGRELLEREGLHRHALVCERHVGTGLTVEDIMRGSMPLPRRDMRPESIEERIICFADKFFSKKDGLTAVEKPLEAVRRSVARYGPDKLRQFDEWCIFFKERG